MFEEGETLPHVELTNQEGKNIYISNFKGKVVALTFIYTRCPLPDFCIRMTNYFSRIQKKLNADKSLNGKWHLLSISFDPKVDSPAVLKKYGRNYDADFRSWDFVTADKGTISTLTDGFGLSVADDEGGLLQHTLRTAILDKDGKVVKIIKGNEWTPDEVVGEIKKLIMKNG
jgi:protein SCO1/2